MRGLMVVSGLIVGLAGAADASGPVVVGQSGFLAARQNLPAKYTNRTGGWAGRGWGTIDGTYGLSGTTTFDRAAVSAVVNGRVVQSEVMLPRTTIFQVNTTVVSPLNYQPPGVVSTSLLGRDSAILSGPEVGAGLTQDFSSLIDATAVHATPSAKLNSLLARESIRRSPGDFVLIQMPDGDERILGELEFETVLPSLPAGTSVRRSDNNGKIKQGFVQPYNCSRTGQELGTVLVEGEWDLLVDSSIYDRYRGPIDGSSEPEAIVESLIEIELNPVFAASEMAVGRVARAVVVLEGWIESQPEDASARRLFGLALIELGEVERGIELVGSAYSLDAGLGGVPIDAVLYENERGRLRDLVTDVVRHANRRPSAEAWLTVAVLMQAEGREGRALRMVVKAERLGLDPMLVGMLEGELGR